MSTYLSIKAIIPVLQFNDKLWEVGSSITLSLKLVTLISL